MPPYCVVPIRWPDASETSAAAGLAPSAQSPPSLQNLCSVLKSLPERRHTTPLLLAWPPNCAVPNRSPLAAINGASIGVAPSAQLVREQKECSTVCFPSGASLNATPQPMLLFEQLLPPPAAVPKR